MSDEDEYHVAVVVSEHAVVHSADVPPREQCLQTEHGLDEFGPEGDRGVG